MFVDEKWKEKKKERRNKETASIHDAKRESVW